MKEEFGERIQFLGVGGQDDASAMQDFIERYGVDTFVHLRDADGSLFERFGAASRSSFLFVDADGSSELFGYGQIDEASLREQVERLLR